MTVNYHIRMRDKCIFNDAVTKVTCHGLWKNEMEHWSKDTERGKPKVLGPKLTRLEFVHHKSHLD